MRANVYIDGFNFYYRAVSRTRYKWLNYRQMVELAYKDHEIGHIRYFTARVKPKEAQGDNPVDHSKVDRQTVYLRALCTIPNFSIHYGKFQTHAARRPLVVPLDDGTKYVEIQDTKEKGSDVNLASHLLMDGFNKSYQLAIVITNDSDLAEPIRMVRDCLGLPVNVLDPQSKVSKQLRNACTDYQNLRTWMLEKSQFPDSLTDKNGVITKPKEW